MQRTVAEFLMRCSPQRAAFKLRENSRKDAAKTPQSLEFESPRCLIVAVGTYCVCVRSCGGQVQRGNWIVNFVEDRKVFQSLRTRLLRDA